MIINNINNNKKGRYTMKNYIQAYDINLADRVAIIELVDKYKEIKKLEKEIKQIKEDKKLSTEKIEKYIINKKLDGIKGEDYLVYVRDYTSSPSLKLVVEEASLSKVINKTIASKLMGLYEDNKKTSRRLTVKL